MDNFFYADVTEVIGLLLGSVPPDVSVGRGGPLGPGGSTVLSQRGGDGSTVGVLYWGSLRGSVALAGGGRGGVAGGGGRVLHALVGALVAADLDGTLEVDFHAVRELERLEVGVAQD